MPRIIEISLRDKIISFAYPIIGMILILLISYDPLNFFDNSTYKLIIALIVLLISFVGFFYHRKKIIAKAKKPSIIEISLRDQMILFAYPIIGMILILLISYDPLNFFDNSTHKLVVGLVVASIPLVPFFYHRKKIMEKAKKGN